MLGLSPFNGTLLFFKKEPSAFSRRYPRKAMILDIWACSTKHHHVDDAKTRAVDAAVSGGASAQFDHGLADAEAVHGLVPLPPTTPTVNALLCGMAG